MNVLRYIFFKITDQPLYRENKRVIFVNVLDSIHNSIYPTNKISNQKYSKWNFLPKTIYEQFSPFITRYFLLIGLLQLWREISPVSSLSTWIPLLLVISVGTAKELADDYFRWRRDQTVNQRLWNVVDYDQSYDNQCTCTKPVQSQDISVGDIVFVKRDEAFPCDLLLLKTASPLNNNNNNNTNVIRPTYPDGVAFIETTNIDGEMDLKRRQSKLQVQNTGESGVGTFQGVIECTPPNNKFDVFDGTMKIIGRSNPFPDDGELLESDIRVSISVNQFLPCGAVLRGTDWIYGIAVYTGNETKLGNNKYRPKSKWTKSDRFINQLTQIIFIIQLILMLLFGICGEIYRRKIGVNMFYLGYNQNTNNSSSFRFVIIPLRFLLLHSILIPVSLKITLDICKIFYSLFINWDIRLFDSRRNFRCQVNNGSIAEDLGQVDVILTDKTGTLTENVMIFKQCVVGSKTYGLQSYQSISEDQEIINDVQNEDPTLIQFMRAITCCHSVALLDNGIYQSSSPDEEALVSGAASCGVKLLRNQFDSLDILLNERQEHFKILHRFPFSSERRRMTVIVKNTQNEEIWIFSKGADDVILPRLSEESENDSETDSMFFQIDNFSQKGFRTLCVACRYFDPDEYQQWSAMYRQACESIHEHSRLVEEAIAAAENRLKLLGVAAVEDRLQPNVSETVTRLKESGISFWMLTGDREETAVQVATAASIVSQEPDAKIRYISGDDPIGISDAVHALVDEAELAYASQTDMSLVVSGKALDVLLQEFSSVFLHLAWHCTGGVLCCRVTPRQKAAVSRLVGFSNRNEPSSSSIIDICCDYGSKCLNWVFNNNHNNNTDNNNNNNNNDNNENNSNITMNNIYNGFKRRTTTVLAIGDGGNDAYMLQEADIGVGLCSQGEEWQAVRAADYVLGKFEFLARLLMVHGRLSYYRSSMVAQFSFYKSLLLAFQQTLFSLFNMFSGASLFGAFPLIAYNTVFTCILPLIFIFDRDVSPETMLRVPVLYNGWRNGRLFNWVSFSQWICKALYQSAAVFIVMSSSLGNVNTVFTNGARTTDIEVLSVASLTAIILIQCATIILEAKIITWVSMFLIMGSFVTYITIMTIFSIIAKTWPIFGVMGILLRFFFITISYFNELNSFTLFYIFICFFPQYKHREPIFYLACFLSVVTAILPVVALKYYQIEYHPSFADSLRYSEYLRRKSQHGIVNSMMYEPAASSSTSNSDWETDSNILLAMPDFQGHQIPISPTMTSTISTMMTSRTSPRSENDDT